MEIYNSKLACNPKLICKVLCWNTNALCMRDSSVLISMVSCMFSRSGNTLMWSGINFRLEGGGGRERYNYIDILIMHLGSMPDRVL